LIANSRATNNLHAGFGQNARDVRGVCVYREAEEELVTDGDQLDLDAAQAANAPE
jgi:hypothetical protein